MIDKNSKFSSTSAQIQAPIFSYITKFDHSQSFSQKVSTYQQIIPFSSSFDNFAENLNATNQPILGNHPNNIIINYTVINNYYPHDKFELNDKKIESSDSYIDRDDSKIDRAYSKPDLPKIDEFLLSIQNFVHFLEASDGEQSTLNPSNLFGITRRRLYDIINVFESVGCLKKRKCDLVFWIGQSNIKNHFDSLIKQRKLDNFDISLEDHFPPEKCIGISNLTVSLILMFYILRIEKLDLRDVANFFSRKSERYRTTLNKLYQIVHITSSINLITRTQNLGEVIIDSNLFGFEIIKENDDMKIDFESIQSFLNTNESKISKNVQKKRKEFEKFISKSRKRHTQ